MLKVGFSLTSEMCRVGVIFEHYIVVELSEKYNSFNLKRSRHFELIKDMSSFLKN